MFVFFFFNDTATTEIYTLSLHDALPILRSASVANACCAVAGNSNSYCRTDTSRLAPERAYCRDRKSTRLNSSHGYISYAVFCLKKKKKSVSEITTDLRVDASTRDHNHKL